MLEKRHKSWKNLQNVHSLVTLLRKDDKVVDYELLLVTGVILGIMKYYIQRAEFYLTINHSTHIHNAMMTRLQHSALHLRNPEQLLYPFFKLFEITAMLVKRM